MRKMFVTVFVLGLLSSTSLIAQHGDRALHGNQSGDGERGERVEKIIEIIGGPGSSHGTKSCEQIVRFGQNVGHSGCNSFGPGSDCGVKNDHIIMMTHLLDLTAEQQAKLKTMQLEFDLKLVDAKAELKKAKLKLKALMSDDDTGKSKVFSAIDKVSDREADIKKMKYAKKLDMHSILTKEQLEKAKQSHYGGGNHKVFEWRSDGSHSGLLHGGKRSIEFIGEDATTDKDGNVFIIKKELK